MIEKNKNSEKKNPKVTEKFDFIKLYERYDKYAIKCCKFFFKINDMWEIELMICS